MISASARETDVLIVGAGHTGNDYCEDGMPVHTVEGQHKTNNTESAATFAPKPMLFVSDGHDRSRWFPKAIYPYIKKIGDSTTWLTVV